MQQVLTNFFAIPLIMGWTIYFQRVNIWAEYTAVRPLQRKWERMWTECCSTWLPTVSACITQTPKVHGELMNKNIWLLDSITDQLLFIPVRFSLHTSIQLFSIISGGMTDREILHLVYRLFIMNWNKAIINGISYS